MRRVVWIALLGHGCILTRENKVEQPVARSLPSSPNLAVDDPPLEVPAEEGADERPTDEAPSAPAEESSVVEPPTEEPPTDGEPPPVIVDDTPRIAGGMTVGSAGCGKAASPGTITLNMTIADRARTAKVSIPVGYDSSKAYPVVFAFHGCTNDNLGPQGYLLSQREAKNKAIIVYPKSIGDSKCFFDGFAGTDGDLDAELFLQMRTRVRDDYCVDMKRTFVTGHSQGALLSNNLACRFGNAEITAVVAHAGSLNADRDNGTDPSYHRLPAAAYVYDAPFQIRLANEPSTACGAHCDTQYGDGAYADFGNEFMCPVDGDYGLSPPPAPKLPPPMLFFHGDADQTWHVRVQRGREAARHWAAMAQCDDDPVRLAWEKNQATQYDNADPCGRPSCAAGHDIEYCEAHDVGHEIWNPDDLANGSLARTWAFFQRY